jgi:hypothetical protein
LTPAEVEKLGSQQGQTEVKADVNRCIGEYDTKEIAANRKAGGPSSTSPSKTEQRRGG